MSDFKIIRHFFKHSPDGQRAWTYTIAVNSAGKLRITSERVSLIDWIPMEKEIMDESLDLFAQDFAKADLNKPLL